MFEINFLALVLAFIFGSLIGSFANVCIYRFHSKESLIFPGSKCPNCQKPILWKDKIPILSWLFLKAKCRSCYAPISARYPLVELMMALLYLATFARFGFTVTTVELLILFSGLVVVSFIDLDSFLLPDVYTLSGIVIGVLGALINPERTLIDALLGLFLGGGFLWAVAYFYFLLRKEEGMGGGDIKLLAWMGAVLGWQSIAFIIISASLVGSLMGLAVASRQSGGLKTIIPFGPSLAFGAVLYVFVGQNIADLYAQFFFPYLSMTP